MPKPQEQTLAERVAALEAAAAPVAAVDDSIEQRLAAVEKAVGLTPNQKTLREIRASAR